MQADTSSSYVTVDGFLVQFFHVRICITYSIFRPDTLIIRRALFAPLEAITSFFFNCYYDNGIL